MIGLRNWRLLKPGDRIDGLDGLHGTVLVNFETGKFAGSWGLEGWGEGGGLLVNTREAGLIRYTAEILDDEDDL